MKYCSKCGGQLNDDDRFCRGCGSTVQVEDNGSNSEDDMTLALSSKTNNIHSSSGSTPVCDTPLAASVKKPGGGLRMKIVWGSLLAIMLVAGGFWGWNTFGTEARVQAKLDLAVKYLSENDYEKAILAFNDAIKIDPKEVKAYQGLARTYTIQGKYDEARSTYDKGLAAVAAEKKQALQIGLAGMYIDQGQLDKAEQAFQEINNSNPSCLEAYFGLAMVYQQKGDNPKAEAMLRKAVENNPNEYRAYNTLALYLKQNNRTDDAFNNLAKSLTLEINQQEAYLILTDLYKGNWNALQSIASLVADRQLAAMLQFYGYYASGDYPKAIALFQESLSQQSGNQKARILAAIAMLKQGDKPGAEALVKQLTKEKLNDWLLSDLARYYLEAGAKDKAQEYALKALKANPTNLDAIALLQTINSADSNTKIYAAQALLFNWKPIIKVKEELLGLNLLVIAKDANNFDTAHLTPNYWIPDINLKYLWGSKKIMTWTQTPDGKYECELHDIGGYSEADTYAIEGDSVLWISGYGGGNGSFVVSGQRIVLKPVNPGESWENSYKARDEAGGNIFDCFEKRTFIGMEPINFMGKDNPAAHIHIEERSSIQDIWLIQNIGIVKKVSNYGGKQSIEIMTEASGELSLSLDQKLIEAVSNNNTEEAKKLLEAGANPNAEGESKSSVLYTAAAKKNLELVKTLLSKGAKPNTANNSMKSTPLHIATSFECTDIIDVLIEAGANPNVQDVNKDTPLLRSIQKGNYTIMQILLNAGADPNARDLWNSTPLIRAVQADKAEMVQLLLNKGADVKLRDKGGKTALDYAREKNNAEILSLLNQ
ncbi:MAG: ankyrin repeat domain-containing protein [Syntrophomonas sp.]